MKIVELQVQNSVVEFIQRLAYETAGLQVLHTHALNAGIPEDQRWEIRQEYLERRAEYEMAKRELWKQYEADYPNAVWHLNFDTGIITIKENLEYEKKSSEPTDME